MFSKLQIVKLKDLTSNNTVLVIIDMVNGFVREGALQSSRIEELVPGILNLSQKCGELGIQEIAFADSHTEKSPEFEAYPVHCIKDTFEADIVEELKSEGGYKLINKNSTNGFLQDEFQDWLRKNSSVDTFIVTGDCTDICVQQFAITLKTWFNMQDRKSRVIVPVNAVETYDFDIHNAELMNVMALYNMLINGIEIVEEII
jgi:nicotinamidase-related amidase